MSIITEILLSESNQISYDKSIVFRVNIYIILFNDLSYRESYSNNAGIIAIKGKT